MNNRGFAKNTSGDYQGAIDDCTKAIKIDQNNADAWSNRGNAKNNLDDHQGAIDDFTKAIELEPKGAAAWNNRGLAKGKLGDHQGAIDDYIKAIELNPKNAIAWSNRGTAKFRLGKYDDAIKDFDESLGLDPKNTNTQQYRQRAEIVKLRKTAEEYKNDHRNQMERELRFFWWSLLFYRLARIALFVFLFELIIAYWFGISAISSILSGQLDLSNLAPVLNKVLNSETDPLNRFILIISRVGILSIIIFPVVWGIQLLNRGIERAETLKWDIFSRANTENSIEYYQPQLGDNRDDIIIAYMNAWINNNPADRLVALQRKKSANEKPKNETLPQEVRDFLKHFTESNTKGD